MDYVANSNNIYGCPSNLHLLEVRERVENYKTSTFVPNPTTGHIANVVQQEEEGVNYVKGGGRKTGKGKGGKRKRE